MTTKSSRSAVLQQISELDVEETLRKMEADPEMHTQSTYTPDIERYPDHQKPFVRKHLDYLIAHPSTDIRYYLMNLRLQIRRR